MEWKAKWIKESEATSDVCPEYFRYFQLEKNVKKATLSITSLGVYEAKINNQRIGTFILAPGWTSYRKRLQYQTYDITDSIGEENLLTVTVGKGWYRGRLVGWQESQIQAELKKFPAGLLAQLEIHYEDGTSDFLVSDENWLFTQSPVLFSEIYDGETYDASKNVNRTNATPVQVFDGPYHTLIPQQGPTIEEQEHVTPAKLFYTPLGELVLDFGQEITGHIQIDVNAHKEDVIRLSFAEVLDSDGNFYTANYRSAKSTLTYICTDGEQSYKPKFTYFGFRYIRVDDFLGNLSLATVKNFTAIVIHSDLERTGFLSCSNTNLNQLFHNIIWGQKCNFLDVPTDCPQRDERLGWTGDAQVFIRTAAMNYDVERFFTKWLADLAADQDDNGRVGSVIPDLLGEEGSSAAWADAATICPWEIYLAYGNKSILSAQFESMKKWIHFITTHTTTKNLWTGGEHFGDWLGLDSPSGSYKGLSREDFIASAFYAYSTSLVIKAGKILGEDVTYFKTLYENIVTSFQETYDECTTQTECVLALYFHLAKDSQKVFSQLVDFIKRSGTQLQTGFVGTPYLLHVLSEFGAVKLAYDLLLKESYPSWLYPVTKGATTIWEHWDGIMENGDFWSPDMNSFNHYAYGSVADWVYRVVAGIKTVEEFPGYEKVEISPIPDIRLTWFSARLKTRYGEIKSEWKQIDGYWQFEIETPVDATIYIFDQTYLVSKGIYLYYAKIQEK